MNIIDFSDSPINETLIYHSAISAYSAKRYIEAIELLEKLVGLKHSFLKETCQYLLVLSYLYTNQNTLAAKLLKEIEANTNHRFSENVHLILSKDVLV